MSLQPGFAVIVATRNRPEALARLLESLEGQTERDFDVILIDQSDGPSLERNVELISGVEIRQQIRHIRSEQRGLSVARNQGFGHATREIMAFPDDDCWYERSLLARVRQWMEVNPAYGFLAGNYAEPGEQLPPKLRRPTDLNRWNMFLRSPSVGLFIRSKVIQQFEVGFDPDLGAGRYLAGGEETDLVLELLRRGTKGSYDPGFLVYHASRAKREISEEVRLRQEAAYTYVLAKHASRLSGPIMLRLVLSIVKAAVRAPCGTRQRASLVARLRALVDYWDQRRQPIS